MESKLFVYSVSRRAAAGMLTAVIMLASAVPVMALTAMYDRAFYSTALGATMHYDVILPDVYTTNGRPCPVLYALPGRTTHHDTWRDNSNLLNSMTGHTFMVVIPNTEDTWYMGAWAVYIAKDLTEHIESKWNVQNVRGITGISMGGYGAFYIAGRSLLLGGKRYHSLSTMSAALLEPTTAFLLDGIVIATRENLADALAPKPFKIFFDCGNEDKFNVWLDDYSLAYRNDLMRDLLRDRGRVLWKDLFYYRPPGMHDWAYWNSRIPVHLDHHEAMFSLYPSVTITSHTEFATTVISTDVARVAGIVYAAAGVSNVIWSSLAKGVKTKGPAIGTDTWYADISNTIGRNVITVTAWAVNGTSNWSSITLFRRNMAFRVRSIAVSKKQVMVKTSDFTHGDVDGLTNGPFAGSFALDGFTKQLTNGWKRSGKYMARYKEKTTAWTVTIVVNGDATRDTATFTFKPRGLQQPTNFFDVVHATNMVPLAIVLGAYRADTNIFLNQKGKFSYPGPWF